MRYSAILNFCNSMKLGNAEIVEKYIDELFNHINTLKNLPVDYVQNICLEMIYAASRAIYELNENIDNIVSSRFEVLDTIHKSVNIFDLQSYIKSIFMTSASYFSKKYNQKNNKVIGKIKDIIRHRRLTELPFKVIPSTFGCQTAISWISYIRAGLMRPCSKN